MIWFTCPASGRVMLFWIPGANPRHCRCQSPNDPTVGICSNADLGIGKQNPGKFRQNQSIPNPGTSTCNGPSSVGKSSSLFSSSSEEADATAATPSDVEGNKGAGDGTPAGAGALPVGDDTARGLPPPSSGVAAAIATTHSIKQKNSIRMLLQLATIK